MPQHPTDPACIFCKIVAGTIPCLKVIEDDRLLAFLDIGPLSCGHTLIVPKGHYATLDQMPDDLAGACAAAAPRLSRAIKAATGASAWNLLQNNGRLSGQAVDHVHFHIIPRREADGLGYRWNPTKLDAEEGRTLLAAIQKAL
ncbi:MAG: HIT family protein [Planctomycetota bacterium]|nr:HIT family protein [Planctomycetota bacterium]